MKKYDGIDLDRLFDDAFVLASGYRGEHLARERLQGKPGCTCYGCEAATRIHAALGPLQERRQAKRRAERRPA